MMKQIWMYAVCLLGAPLAAETIGNVEFQFPPSRYEWKLLLDEQTLNDFVSFVDEDESEPYSENEEALEENLNLKIFTHREGDALELFIAMQAVDYDFENDVETLNIIQSEVDVALNQFFPNHKFIVHAYSENRDGGFIEWEINDGIQDIMHGYSRGLFVNENGVPRVTTLCYFTTARTTEHNRIMWAEMLSQVRFIE